MKKDLLHRLDAAAAEDLSPAKAKGILRELTDILKEDSEPLDCDNDFFIGCYTTLEQAARQYPTLMPEEQPDYLTGNLKVLDILEFQASWHVLKEIGKIKFKESDPENRQEAYLRVLYRQAEDYPFFEQRKKAILELSNANMIHRPDYEPHLN